MLNKDEILQQLNQIDNLEDLYEFYKKYLGKKGYITQEFKTLGQLEENERKEKGQFLSTLKEEIESIYNEKEQNFKKQKINEQLNEDIIDVTTPGLQIEKGHYTLITKTRRQIEDIMKGMGFLVEYGKDLVTKYENFYSLNIPPSHPAIDMQDTIFTEETNENGEELLLRSQTSASQNHLMKKYGPPLKIILPGRVYRYDKVDASHDTMFWQFEGLVVDKNISIAHMKDTLTKILSAIFEKEVKIRMRPAYFPFVEPGVEIDASCPICNQEGCSLCKGNGWIEVLGAGMVHPNVLKEGNIDPEKYSGFAFGMGLTRLVVIKYGIKDVRLLNSGDLKFTKSFS